MILAIDTSGQNLGLALANQGRIVASLLLNPGLKHGEILQNCIAKFLNEAETKLSELSGLAVTMGPGSFTGLRIGLAAAKGYCYALNLPLAGLSTLEAGANAFANTPRPVVVIFDARRNEFYWATFNCSGDIPARLSGDSVGPMSDLKDLAKSGAIFFGPAALQNQFSEHLGVLDYRPNDDFNLAIPTTLYGEKDIQRNRALDRNEVVPIYIRF
jgi:tRNA threonylcarbamoyladenosine biosynthesis protein TsaB